MGVTAVVMARCALKQKKGVYWVMYIFFNTNDPISAAYSSQMMVIKMVIAVQFALYLVVSVKTRHFQPNLNQKTWTTTCSRPR